MTDQLNRIGWSQETLPERELSDEKRMSLRNRRAVIQQRTRDDLFTSGLMETPSPAESVDTEAVARFISSGGRKSLVKIYTVLKQHLDAGELQSLIVTVHELSTLEKIEFSDAHERRNDKQAAFVLHANQLDSTGHRNRAMDLLYERIDEMMRTGRFESLDEILSSITVHELSIDILLGLLTATLPAKTRLPSRPTLFQEIEKVLRERNEYEEGLLTGLE